MTCSPCICEPSPGEQGKGRRHSVIHSQAAKEKGERQKLINVKTTFEDLKCNHVNSITTWSHT